MQRTNRRQTRAVSLRWGMLWLILGACAAAWPAAVLGQTPADQPLPWGLPPDSFLLSDRLTGRGQQSIGAVIRGGFVTGPGIGREDSFVPLEFMPYSMFGHALIFGDLRGFRTTQDQWGANVGMGFRYYVDDWDRIFGINAYFDYDNSSTALFRQYGLGLETYGAGWDMRLNTYFPIQRESKLLGIEFLPDSVRFQGFHILYDQNRLLGTPMRGLDHEVGIALPGRVLQAHEVRLYGGWYHFQGEQVDNAWGWKGRLQGNLLPNLSLGLEITNDQVFDTNVIFQVAASYGGYREPDDQPRTQFSRMTTPVYRQYNIVVGRHVITDVGLIARKPDGTPYFVEHVASNNPYDRSNPAVMASLAPWYNPTAPLGSYENPYLTIAQAQLNDGAPVGVQEDIIFTWANSVYTGQTITLEQNVRVLGEGDGVPHRFQLDPFGQVLMPRAVDTAGVDQRPQFLSMPGNGVTLASNAEFSGFLLGDANNSALGPAGHGIVGINVNNVDINFNEINYAAGDGVLLQNATEVNFLRTRIFNAAQNGLHIDGGIARVTFEGSGNFDAAAPLAADADIVYTNSTPGQHAVLIDNVAAGSFIDLFGATPAAIFYNNAGGVLINNSGGSARFGDIYLAGVQAVAPTAGEGINILNSSGAFTFASPIQILRATGDSINVEGLTSTGIVTFQQPISIVDRGSRGIDLRNNAGTVNFITPLTGQGVSITTALAANYSADPAIEIQNNSGSIGFSNLNIDGGLGTGIVIGDLTPNNNTGGITFRGSTTLRNIAGINIDVLDDGSSAGGSFVEFRGVDIDNRGSTGIRLANNQMPIRFLGRTAIANTLVSSNTAMLITGNAQSVSFETVVIDDAYNNSPAVNTVAGVSITDNPSRVSFNNLSITTLGTSGGVANNGVALFARRVGQITLDPITNEITSVTGGLFVDTGVIDATNESAIDVMASVIGMTFQSVSSIDPIGPGIILANNISGRRNPDFGVLGLSLAAAGNGGTIDGATTDTFVLESLIDPPSVVTSGDGVYLNNTGVVVLNQMIIRNNAEAGIEAETSSLSIDSGDISNNTHSGLLGLNLGTLNVTQTIFAGNGVAGVPNNEIRVLVNEQGTYNWLFDSNTITDVNNSAVLLGTTGAGAGSTLNLSFVNNTVTLPPNNVANSAGLALGDPVGTVTNGWDGVLNALIDGNAFVMQDDTNTAIDITTLNTTAATTVVISDNDIRGTADGDIGIMVDARGPSNYTINNNVINLAIPNVLATRDARGMQFDLAPNATLNIFDNVMTLTGEFADGIVFNTITAPADVTIEGNTITITDLNGTLGNELGIDFLLPTGNIQLRGNRDNIITITTNPLFPTNGFGFPWFRYNGTQFSGSILVNGVPQP
ncbi:MAG: hypothetical protein KatS3mg114_0276 [Planctomycetaceae bacterium]|nr:MAG: hypothetical protein KatS3mg114_0276 [Planctomycetaceae bacterium]